MALTGSVSAVAQRQEVPAGNELAWPLTRRMSTITGLIAEPGQPITAMARFDLASEAMQLRTLRSRTVMLDMYAASIPVSDAGATYRLWLRDELPDGVAAAIDVLRARPTP
jgi:hypothetical protein